MPDHINYPKITARGIPISRAGGYPPGISGDDITKYLTPTELDRLEAWGDMTMGPNGVFPWKLEKALDNP